MLSKSQYIRGLQCHKSLWLYKNRPDLRAQPDKQKEALFETGQTVGDLACGLFPGGIEIEFTPEDFGAMSTKTRQLIDSGVEIIYEATFREKGIFAMADILVKTPDGWDMYEVKASTRVKPYHQDDAAIQWYALAEAIPLNRAFIIHVDNQYVRQGELDIHGLFSIVDITEIVQAKQAAIPEKLQAMEAMLKTDGVSIDIGPHCSDPFDCDFKSCCWQHIPRQSVFNLYRLSGQRKFELYRQGKVRFEDLTFGDGFNETQLVQANSALTQQAHIDRPVIQAFLDKLEYPLNFFDFETYQEAIPRFDGQRPYMQLPFQYSLHIVPEVGGMVHRELLGDEHSDPREALIQHVLDDISPSGSIVAFNMGFEKARIRELADAFPQYRDELLALNERFVDLIEPFRGLGYYHPDFNGSFSIKSVLPAMFPDDPELDYKSLEIQDGGMAMETFANLHKLKDKSQREAIRNALLAYCRLDTLAMVKIFERLAYIGGQ
jgi:hypothetical protein